MGRRLPSAVALSASIAALVVAVVFGTHAAGGSDSSCYLNAAALLARGAVALDEPLARAAPWPNPALTFTPAGFTSSPVDPASLVPICPPGLPLVLAAFRALRISEFLAVPLLAALAVWLTFAIGRRVDRPLTGALAAALTLCSPTFLYQAVQPMSDVPATAWWLLAIACATVRENGSTRPARAGLAASMAILTRPNLLPLAAIIAVHLFARASGDRRRQAARFIAGLIPGVLLLAALQRGMYGSLFATGYGNAAGLLSVGHVLPNLRRYAEWLLSVHTPFLVLAPAAPFLMRRRAEGWLLVTFSAATVGCYLPYLVFDAWWYTRFLLPAIPLLAVLSVAALLGGLDRLAAVPSPVRLGVGSASVVIVMALWLTIAFERHAFDLAELEQHYRRAGAAVASQVPPPAAIVTARDSGSVLFHFGRPTLSWDALPPDALDPALAFVRDRGYPPYLLLETDEEPAFRERFGRTSAIGRLDWPPRVQAGRDIRIYDPRDRARFLEDGQVRTVFLEDPRPQRRTWRRWFR